MPFVSLLLPGGKRVGGYGYKTTKRRVQKKVGKYGLYQSSLSKIQSLMGETNFTFDTNPKYNLFVL